jgi:hypothetical protein
MDDSGVRPLPQVGLRIAITSILGNTLDVPAVSFTAAGLAANIPR